MLKSRNATEWAVTYKAVDANSTGVEQTVYATCVILGAGAIGSTKILLRSKTKGLNVSSELGNRFSTNGDVLASSFCGTNEVNALGIPFQDAPGAPSPPGPTITTVVDFRTVTRGSFDRHHIIEDFGFPVTYAGPYIVGLAVQALFKGDSDSYPDLEDLQKFHQVSGL